MEGLLPLLIIIISFALSASNRRKRQAASQRAPAKAVPVKAAVNKAPKKAGIPKTMPEPLKAQKEEPDEDSDRDGSIDMPPMEPHEHEGKPMPCPAEERELIQGYLDDVTGVYQTPKGYYVDDADVEAFDKAFPPKEKLRLPGQIF